MKKENMMSLLLFAAVTLNLIADYLVKNVQVKFGCSVLMGILSVVYIGIAIKNRRIKKGNTLELALGALIAFNSIAQIMTYFKR